MNFYSSSSWLADLLWQGAKLLSLIFNTMFCCSKLELINPQNIYTLIFMVQRQTKKPLLLFQKEKQTVNGVNVS